MTNDERLDILEMHLHYIHGTLMAATCKKDPTLILIQMNKELKRVIDAVKEMRALEL